MSQLYKIYTSLPINDHKAKLQPSRNSLPNDKILDSSKLREFANYNFKFDENGRKFSKRVENTVGKGEIARFQHFLLFPQFFQKTFTADIENRWLVSWMG